MIGSYFKKLCVKLEEREVVEKIKICVRVYSVNKYEDLGSENEFERVLKCERKEKCVVKDDNKNNDVL